MKSRMPILGPLYRPICVEAVDSLGKGRMIWESTIYAPSFILSSLHCPFCRLHFSPSKNFSVVALKSGFGPGQADQRSDVRF